MRSRSYRKTVQAQGLVSQIGSGRAALPTAPPKRRIFCRPSETTRDLAPIEPPQRRMARDNGGFAVLGRTLHCCQSNNMLNCCGIARSAAGVRDYCRRNGREPLARAELPMPITSAIARPS